MSRPVQTPEDSLHPVDVVHYPRRCLAPTPANLRWVVASTSRYSNANAGVPADWLRPAFEGPLHDLVRGLARAVEEGAIRVTPDLGLPERTLALMAISRASWALRDDSLPEAALAILDTEAWDALDALVTFQDVGCATLGPYRVEARRPGPVASPSGVARVDTACMERLVEEIMLADHRHHAGVDARRVGEALDASTAEDVAGIEAVLDHAVRTKWLSRGRTRDRYLPVNWHDDRGHARVLEALGWLHRHAAPKPRGVNEIAASLDLARSGISRMVSDLRNAGLVVQTEAGLSAAHARAALLREFLQALGGRDSMSTEEFQEALPRASPLREFRATSLAKVVDALVPLWLAGPEGSSYAGLGRVHHNVPGWLPLALTGDGWAEARACPTCRKPWGAELLEQQYGGTAAPPTHARCAPSRLRLYVHPFPDGLPPCAACGKALTPEPVPPLRLRDLPEDDLRRRRLGDWPLFRDDTRARLRAAGWAPREPLPRARPRDYRHAVTWDERAHVLASILDRIETEDVTTEAGRARVTGLALWLAGLRGPRSHRGHAFHGGLMRDLVALAEAHESATPWRVRFAHGEDGLRHPACADAENRKLPSFPARPEA